MKNGNYLLIVIATVAIGATTGCGGIKNMYGITYVGHHYKTNVNPHPLILMEDITFCQPVVSYYNYTINRSEANLPYPYFYHPHGSAPWFQSKFVDSILSGDLYKRYPVEKRVLDENKTDTLSRICYQALSTMDFNKKHFLVSQLPSFKTAENLAAAWVYNFSSQANEDSMVLKIINLPGNRAFYSTLKTSYIGFITVVYINELLKDDATGSILDSKTAIQLKLYLVNTSHPSSISTYKSVTLSTGIYKNEFTYTTPGQLDSLKIVKFFKLAYKELLNDKTFKTTSP